MPLHRLPMKMAFDTGMLLPAFVISSECEKSFSFAVKKGCGGERAMGNTVLHTTWGFGVS